MQGIVAHRTQADGVDILGGDRGHHLEGIGWRLLLLSPQLATGTTRAYLAQIAIGIEALVPIIPEDAHLTLIVPLDLHRIDCRMGVSQGLRGSLKLDYPSLCGMLQITPGWRYL